MASTFFPPEVLIKILEHAFLATDEEGGAEWFYNLRTINGWFENRIVEITSKTDDKGVQRALCLHNVPRVYLDERARYFFADDDHNYKAIHREWVLMHGMSRERVREGSKVEFNQPHAFQNTAMVMNGTNSAFVCGNDSMLRWALFWPNKTDLHVMPLQTDGPTLGLRGVATVTKKDLVVAGVQMDFNVVVVAKPTSLSAYEFHFENGDVSWTSVYSNSMTFPHTATRKLNMSSYRYILH